MEDRPPVSLKSGVYLLRHGETEWNRDGRLQGRRDSPLTERGRRQAREMGEALSRLLGLRARPHVLSSPLERARTTAEIVIEAGGLDTPTADVEDSLAELCFGEWEGLTKSEIEDSHPGELARRDADIWSYRCPGGESYEDVDHRVRAWAYHHEGRRVTLLVTHEIVSRVLRGAILGLSSKETSSLDHPHGRIYALRTGSVERL